MSCDTNPNEAKTRRLYASVEFIGIERSVGGRWREGWVNSDDMALGRQIKACQLRGHSPSALE